jgi:uncharacterized protein (DUF362 family)
VHRIEDPLSGLDNIQRALRHFERISAAKGMTRRNFLKVSGLALAVAALPYGCKAPRAGFDEPVDDVIRLMIPPEPSGEISVGLVGKGEIAEMVHKAIEMAGGLNEIHSRDTVAIKPNLTTGYSLQYRVTTHPEVLRAVIREVKSRTGPGNITVTEASSYMDPSTLEVAKKVGVYDVVRSEGVKFLAWEDEEYVEVGSDGFKKVYSRLHIPRCLTDSRFDHFINVPMLKNHDAITYANAEYTCCIKNHVGVLSRQDRTGAGGRGIHQNNLGDQVAELNLAVPAHTMNVVDAMSIILAGGPASRHMQAADPGLILASKDRVACDSLGVAVLRYYASQMGIKRPYVNKSVWEQAQITRAQELNLGRSKENIGVESYGVDEIDGILSKWK